MPDTRGEEAYRRPATRKKQALAVSVLTRGYDDCRAGLSPVPEPNRLSNNDLWSLALVLASGAVVVIAVLFGFVITVLQRIDRHAARTYTAAKQISQNTVALWTLEQMNRDLVAIRDAARGAQRARTATAVAAPLTAAVDKVQGWLGGSDQDDDKSS